MIELVGGRIRLPSTENVVNQATQEVYEKCLKRLPQALGKHIGVACRIVYSECPELGARFLGEMQIAGFLKFKSRFGRTYEENMLIVEPTAELNRVPIHAFEDAPVEPVTTFKGNPHIEVRKGVLRTNKSWKQSKDSYEVVKTIQREVFTINDFALDVLTEYPAIHSDKPEYIMYKRCMHYARKFQHLEFMFPNYLDSRGRTYDSTTVGFSPQGADHEKALVIPTYKEVLTKDGYSALLEATNGYSEKEWTVEDHIRHARDWFKEYYSWSQAEYPYQYIVCADLIRRYHEDPLEPLPAFTPLDGRCSGLQHWSAVTRSTAITNRLGMQREEAEDGLDIYEYVGFRWEKTLPEDQKQYASRKAAKIPTMTWGYNATRMTSIEHIHDLFGEEREWNDGGWTVTRSGLDRKATAALGSDLYNRLHETLGALSEAVKWVGECARVIGKTNLYINWRVPDGFIGQQKKVVMKEVRLQPTLSDGRRMDVTVSEPTRRSDSRRHVSSLAPNFIHSMDACHLRMVARRLHEDGLPMVFVHDSFATHSNYRNTLYRYIVEEFIKLYDRNVLVDLKADWENVYEIKLPDPPELGDWEVDSLANCDAFFA